MFIVLTVLSVFCASLPMLGFLLLIWWLDRHEREPVWLFGLTFCWGAIAAVGFALVGSELLMMPLRWGLGATLAEQYSAVLVAPLVEEPSKALVLFAVMQSRHFDNATDGFVYGAAAGLGFGMTENFLYFTSAASSGDALGWMSTVVIRTFYSALMHGGATSCVGAMLGFARFRSWGWKLAALPLGFGAAMGMHALWNGLLTLDALRGGGQLYTSINFAIFPLELFALLGVFQLALWDERATIRRELADEVRAGLLPLKDAVAIASYLRRSRREWVPPGVPQWPYIRAVTRLAFRKHQCRNSTGARHRLYAEDVLRLRREIGALQALARVR